MQNTATPTANTDLYTIIARERQALAYLLNGLKEMGFGSNESINGGDAVDGMAEMYNFVTRKILKGKTKTPAPPMPRIVVDLDGGLLQNIYSEVPVQYLIYDHDVDGTPPEETVFVPDLHMDAHLGSTAEVFHNVGPLDAIHDPEKVANAFKAAVEREEKAEQL